MFGSDASIMLHPCKEGLVGRSRPVSVGMRTSIKPRARMPVGRKRTRTAALDALPMGLPVR